MKLKATDGLLILGFLLVIVGIGINFKSQFGETEKAEIVSKTVSPTVKNEAQIDDSKITIDIAGEVVKPGVYKLEKGAVLDEVLVMAGGLGPKADQDWIEKNLNKAEKLYDGQKIYIPNKTTSGVAVLGVSAATNIIRINTASVEDLDKLEGVGPAIAQRIVDYRTKSGGFKSVEEIKLVPGIGDKMFEKIKDEIQL